MLNGKAEYQHLLAENDELRIEIAQLREAKRQLAARLTALEQRHQEDASYLRELWNDNQRVHAELRYLNRGAA
jgi:hypothetical protein